MLLSFSGPTRGIITVMASEIRYRGGKVKIEPSPRKVRVVQRAGSSSPYRSSRPSR